MSRTIHVVPSDVADPRPRGLASSRVRHPRLDELGHREVMLRLALWLADVAAETALEATAGAPRSPGRLDDPPIAGSAS